MERPFDQKNKSQVKIIPQTDEVGLDCVHKKEKMYMSIYLKVREGLDYGPGKA